MLKLIYEMFVGHAEVVKNKTVGTIAYFGMVIMMTAVYLSPIAIPLLLIVVAKGLPLSGLLIAILPFGLVALGVAASTVDTYIDKLQRQVTNEPMRGKPLDDKIEGE